MNSFSIESLQSFDPIEFENIAKALLIKMGFNATTTKASGDGGIDIIAINEQPIIGGKYVIQCKRYATGNNIGEPVVRELYGVMHAENANKGILITTSDFSRQAINFAQDKAIELINGNVLLALLNKHLADLEVNAEDYLARKEFDQNIIDAERFDGEIIMFFQKEKLRTLPQKVSVIEYGRLFESGKGPSLLEFSNIASYYDKFIYDIFKKAMEIINVSDYKEGELEAKMVVLFELSKKDPEKKVFFTLIDEYYERILKLYQSLISIGPPLEAKEHHGNFVRMAESLFIIFSALREYNKTNNPLLYIRIVHGIHSLLTDMDRSDQVFRDFQTKINQQINKGSRFIATVIYNSLNTKEVNILRLWRDNSLSNYWLGNQFIKLYCKIGPAIACYIADKNLIKIFLKKIFDIFVKLLQKNKCISEAYNDKRFD
ncbi:MAG TPA: restriction endonuclease [Candidatus Nanoarchaeia archaeon]|nr:restriction endonuclease [Candidatus Nanoarchaeia archaeon]